jgi:hypothetical protein
MTRKEKVDEQFNLLKNPETFNSMTWKEQQRYLRFRYMVVKRIDKKGVINMVKRAGSASKGFIKIKSVLPIQNNA